MKTLKTSTSLRVRFNEVDSMNIVWHGSYALYLEDAREAFGKQHGIDYLTIFANGYYTPLVELNIEYKSPLAYGDEAKIDIEFHNTDAAKIVFEYKIYNTKNDKLVAKASTTQVFLDKDYQLMLYAPAFFTQWKKEKGLS